MVREEIVVVPHTHWDREWYEPHDVFRLRLVHVLDGLLELLESEPAYRFTLDGQSAAVADYLEMRPENRGRVERAVAAGQLAVGPFLILLDEFCCDGESIVRNLELGTQVARELGPEMRVGYLPDMFGHVAQMPQILTGWGIADAALWRGVPGAVAEHGFTWEALDGSQVRCEYLFDGYGSALDLFALEGQLPRLASRYCHEHTSWFGPDAVLGMLGTDHMAPPPDLVARIAAHTAAGELPALSVATLEQYLAGVDRTAPRPLVRGELRSHARGNLLPGVFSIRTLLKQAMAHAERTLTVAERLDALVGTLDHARFLRTGWYRLVESTAHDSVTGCGVDATADQVGGRLSTAAHLARGVAERVLEEAAREIAPERVVVANPSGFARRAHVELTLAVAAADLPPSLQAVAELPVVLGEETLRTAELPKLLRRIHGRELFGQQINAWQIADGAVRFDVAEVPVGVFDLAAFTEALDAAIASDPGGAVAWRVSTVAAPRTRVVAAVDLAGLAVIDVALGSGLGGVAAVRGVRVWERGGGGGEGGAAGLDGMDGLAGLDGRAGLDNGILAVEIHDDGTATLRTGDHVVERALALLDEGDRGDSYNYGPLAHDEAVTVPESVAVEVLERGPHRGRVLVVRTYSVPDGVDPADRDRRTAERSELVTRTVLELRDGEPFLRVSVNVVNPVRDHRLRVLLPAGTAPVTTSQAAGQYGVTERGREGEGGWGEFPLPTYPATRFVAAGDVTALVRQLTEYEVVSTPGGEVLALTLLRAVGLMSVNVHPLRDEPAGSEIAVPGAQYLGTEVTTSFAVLPSPQGWEAADAVRWADLERLDPMVMRGRGKEGADGSVPPGRVRFGGAADEASSGALALESLRRVGGGLSGGLSGGAGAGPGDELEVRLVNYAGHDVPAPAWTAHWRACDLRGVPVEPREVVRGGEIATWRRPT